MKNVTKAVILAVLAAILYGVSAPLAKLLLVEISPILLAAALYLGAGIGLLTLRLARFHRKTRVAEAALSRGDWPLVLVMVVLDVAAPILLMIALTLSPAAHVSLLNNFEIVATALVALLIFKEAIGRRMWLAIILITAASFLLSVGDNGFFSFSAGSLLVLAACVCWGFENSCTRLLSAKDPLEIGIFKGFGSGIGSLVIAVAVGQFAIGPYLWLALLLGFLSYGLSIYFYVLAQRTLGAARTSAYYAVAPFAGVALAMILFGQQLTWLFAAAVVIMLAGASLAASERHRHAHSHPLLIHEHRHNHQDEHHTHLHNPPVAEHNHVHMHEEIEHSHEHTPDQHHHHRHDHGPS
jgi:drug/metabolite transporter (DMT)-like permease